jgi:hypothetical protein
MTTISSVPGTGSSTVGSPSSVKSAPRSDFSSYLQDALGVSSGDVNEEQLFAAVLQQRLNETNPDAATYYSDQKNSLAVSMARPNGMVSMEDVAKAALRATVDAGRVTKDAGEKALGEAFALSQLDSNKEALYDGFGGPGDPTRAVAPLQDALTTVELALSSLKDAEPPPLPLDTPSNGKAPSSVGNNGDPAGESATLGEIPPAPSGLQKFDGPGGAVWKPKSVEDGKLMIVIPNKFSGYIQSVGVYKALPPNAANKLEEGTYSGTMERNREIYRFSKEGGAYGEGVYMVVQNNDGTKAWWPIKHSDRSTD